MTTNALVVVPTLNEAPHIASVLRQLLETPRESLALRVVVADGGSSDGTREIVEAMSQREPRLRLMPNPDRVQSAAVNWAVRRFGRDADVLIRCDAHADYPPDYCGRLVETLERTGADAVVVPLDSRGESSLQRAIAWVSNSPIGTGGSAHRAGRQSGFVDHGHHAAFRLQSFRAAGGYDPSFTHNEDAELDCRQRALGARIYLDSDIRVGYSPRESLTALYRQYFKYGEGRSRTVRRHPHSLRLRQLAVPAHLLVSALALLAAPWQPWLLIWPALYVCSLLLASFMLAMKHRSLTALWCSVAALTMHTAWALGFLGGFWAHRERLWARHMAVPLRVRPITGEIS
jgi:succinoglycan biosynthesis protein ExoA